MIFINNNKTFPVEILLVEDNPGDVRLLEHMFEESLFPVNIHAVHNGLDALNYLYQKNEYTDAIKPGIIILDIHLPIMSGIEVLRAMSKQKNLRDIPVFVLTNDPDKEAKLQKYTCLNYAFLTKPTKLEEYNKVVVSIAEFWIKNHPEFGY